MDEINPVISKYDVAYIRDALVTAEDVSRFAATFYKDVASIYDTITRTKNVERNPSGFSLNDASILGLLVRIWKLLKEIIRYYEENNAEIAGVLDRPLLEAAVTATYLLQNDDDVIRDYRKCSYRHRLRMLAEYRTGSAFFDTKAGKRLLSSISEKMKLEALTEADFEVQKKNRWRVQGKSFFDIFGEVHDHDDAYYAMSYGIMSESMHASWNDSIDYCLVRNDDNTFTAFPFYQTADVRFVSPLLLFTQPAFRMWLQRIDAYDDGLKQVLDWIDRVNRAIVSKHDEKFDGP